MNPDEEPNRRSTDPFERDIDPLLELDLEENRKQPDPYELREVE